MIFVCLGTKRFPFNRLLKQIDHLIERDDIREKVFAQIGSSTYKPKNYEFSRFLTPDKYNELVNQSSIIITHGGTGAIVKGLKAKKQVIAVPRRKKYLEHSDDHQLQIVELFTTQGHIWRVDEMKDLKNILDRSMETPIIKEFEGKGKIIKLIDDFISEDSLK